MNRKPELKTITDEAGHAAALARIEALWEAEPGTPDHDELEIRALLVEDYERRAFPVAEPDPVEAIKFRMEQLGMDRTELAPILGSRSKVSEVLNRKIGLSLKMIRSLHETMRIPYEALIPPGGAKKAKRRPGRRLTA